MQSVVPRTVASTSTGNLLEIQILKAHPRPPDQNISGLVPVACVLVSSPGDSEAHWSLRNYDLYFTPSFSTPKLGDQYMSPLGTTKI